MVEMIPLYHPKQDQQSSYSHYIQLCPPQKGVGEAWRQSSVSPLGKSFFPNVRLQSPVLSWSVLGQDCWKMITELPAKEDHRRAEANHRVWGVPVQQERPCQLVCVKSPFWPQVLLMRRLANLTASSLLLFMWG